MKDLATKTWTAHRRRGGTTSEGRRQALEEFRQPKTAGVIVDVSRGQVAVDFHPGDFTQGEDMAEKEDTQVAETFSEEIFVAQIGSLPRPGYPNSRG